MICRRCGAQFEGNFCPNCGAKYGMTQKEQIERQNAVKKQLNIATTRSCLTLFLIVFGIAVIIVVGINILASSGNKNEKQKMTFNEYLISASQYAIIQEYDLPITTDFADKTNGNYDIVKTKTENVYNIGGTVRIKNNNGILKDYKYVAKIEYLPKSNEYKGISAKIIE